MDVGSEFLGALDTAEEGDDDGGGMSHGLLEALSPLESPQMFSDDGDLDEISTPGIGSPEARPVPSLKLFRENEPAGKGPPNTLEQYSNSDNGNNIGSSAVLPPGTVDAFDLPGEPDAMAVLEAEMRREQALALQNIAVKPKPETPFSYVKPKDIEVTGMHNDRQAHKLLLRSAYDRYAWDGEPPMTAATIDYIGTLDYIMYSKEKLVPRTLLSLPDLEDIVNEDPRELEMVPDESCGVRPPKGWVEIDPTSSKSSQNSAGHQPPLNYTGKWVGPIKENERKMHHFLPNREYPSNHLALMVEFTFLREGLESDWSEQRVINPFIKSS